MGRRSTTPGLIRRRNSQTLYWSARGLARDIAGYPDPLIRLPSGASDAEVERLCQKYAAALEQWRAEGERPRWRYEGTVASLCDVFERHPVSPVHNVSRATARYYASYIALIRANVGARAVRALTAVDVLGWYRRWRAPEQPGMPERVDRAHDAVSVFRMVLRFGAVLEFPRCRELSSALHEVRFERGRGRKGALMTLEQARAIIAAGVARTRPRYLHVAIGVAAQFETTLRQKDIIGEWHGGAWSGRFTWENIPGGVFRVETSKTGATAVFDLTDYELLWPLLQKVPQAQRVGAIVKGDGLVAVRAISYRRWFRELAEEAGVPRSVWNMDARAGGITEAREAGASLDDVRLSATHSQSTMTTHYIRETGKAIKRVGAARKAARNAQ
jgi:hypothetical protein